MTRCLARFLNHTILLGYGLLISLWILISSLFNIRRGWVLACQLKHLISVTPPMSDSSLNMQLRSEPFSC